MPNHKKTRSFFTSKSVVHQWTLSFIIVLIVPIILNFIAYLLSIHSIEKETTKTNLSFYENTQRQIDTTLLSYRKVAEVLSSMTEIQENMDPDDPQVFDAIKSTLLLYDVDLKDVYLNFLYYKSYDTVATCSKKISSQAYFDSTFSNINLSFVDWKNWLDKSYSSEYLFLEGKKATPSEGKRYLALKLKVSGTLTGACYVVVLEDSFFFKQVDGVPYIAESEFAVLSGDHHILASTSPSFLSNLEFYNDISGASGTLNQRIDKEECIVSYIVSPVNGWKYFYATPKSVYLRSVAPIKYMQLFILAAALIIGLFLILMMVRRLYTPIRKLLDLFPDIAVDWGEYDEYHQIESVLKNSVSLTRQAKRVLNEQQEQHLNDYLIHLLKGIPLPEDHDANTDFMRIFNRKNFVVLLFYLTDYKVLFLDEPDLTDTRRYSLMRSIVINILGEELENANYTARFIDIDGTLACIVNFDDVSWAQPLMGHIISARSNIEKYFYVTFGVAVSNAVQRWDYLNVAHDECRAVLEYLSITEEANIICFQDISQNASDLPLLSSYALDDIAHCIQSVNYEAAQQAIHLLIDPYTSSDRFSPLSFRYVTYQLTMELIRRFRPYIHDEQSINKLFEKNTISVTDILSLVRHICETLTSNVSQSEIPADKKRLMAEDIKEYLDNNYKDCDLNVAKIADRFGYAPSYLSKVFKESETISIIDYLNRLRVTQAKHLLEQTNLLLADISEQTGFYTAASLIRVFKKYEKITPGNYKKFYCKHQTEELL